MMALTVELIAVTKEQPRRTLLESPSTIPSRGLRETVGAVLRVVLLDEVVAGRNRRGRQGVGCERGFRTHLAQLATGDDGRAGGERRSTSGERGR